jgi:CBS domain-containing protein
MRVSDVMTRNVECIRPEANLQEAAAKMKSLDIGPLPVCENDRLIGLITDRDITIRAVAEGEDPQKIHVRDIMTPDILYCFEDQLVSEASEMMKENQVRRLVVMNRDKRLVGIVSLGDLALETHDEELVGATLEAVSEPSTAPIRP